MPHETSINGTFLRTCFSFSWTLLFVFDPLPFSFPHTAEIGDYDDIADSEFLKMNKLLPYQERVQEKIMELHRRHM